MISTFTRAQNGALELGSSEDIETYLMVSGMMLLTNLFTTLNFIAYNNTITVILCFPKKRCKSDIYTSNLKTNELLCLDFLDGTEIE